MTEPPTPAPLVVRPVRLTRVCRVIAAIAVLAFVGIGFSLRLTGDGAATFRLSDQIAMSGLGVLLALGVLSLTRSQVVADTRGIRVRNVLGDTYLPWQVVIGIRLDDGEPWARLDLQDDERVALLAVQSNDGERATRAVLHLRRLLAASRTPPPSDRPDAPPRSPDGQGDGAGD